MNQWDAIKLSLGQSEGHINNDKQWNSIGDGRYSNTSREIIAVITRTTSVDCTSDGDVAEGAVMTPIAVSSIEQSSQSHKRTKRQQRKEEIRPTRRQKPDKRNRNKRKTSLAGNKIKSNQNQNKKKLKKKIKTIDSFPTVKRPTRF